MKNLLAAALLASATLVASPAYAQSGAEIHAGDLEVAINKSQIVTADRPIDRAMIGNDKIADVLPVSDRSIYILGKEVGTTSLTLYDKMNRVIAVMDISVGPDAEALRTQFAEMFPDQSIDVRVTNGKLMLSGVVKDAGVASRAAQMASAFAGENVINMLAVGSPQQVMLEVRFAEVNRTVGEKLGVSGFAGSLDGDFRGVTGRGAAAVPDDVLGNRLQADSILDNFGVFSALFQLGDVNIEAFLNALEEQGLSKTLAEPTLVALSGEKASFLAGGEFPIPVVQGGNAAGGAGGGQAAITIQFKAFGVSLGFTPTVLGDKVINLIVEPEVSSLDPSSSVTINGLTVPGLQTRRASTTLELRDGESFVLAGLLRTEYQTNVQQLPILGSIPIIGSLFRSTQFQKGETELLIVVTPRLVKPIRPDQVQLPTDRVADPDAVETLLFGNDYKPQALPPAGQAPAKGDNGYEY
ncbi:type II and III secretion system protein family protein [Porphyrobacter sp. LM 6]|uniref:type II and III secretion system protein family protein n=1 Tax=Porphyrobacter sp. LM 6 TaxID=1896196 RepID=UPI00084733DB|nr:type II and III secretion system protein family protein [Porphyrobacter sp. LM 6]AOL93188.1 pilus assembly protein CpaC [Porphyrobacter sp. LM 6]